MVFNNTGINWQSSSSESSKDINKNLSNHNFELESQSSARDRAFVASNNERDDYKQEFCYLSGGVMGLYASALAIPPALAFSISLFPLTFAAFGFFSIGYNLGKSYCECVMEIGECSLNHYLLLNNNGLLGSDADGVF